jgi:malate dehydrogenase
MSTLAIIGAGDLGGAIAQALAAGDRVGRVVLVDAAAQVAAGKALDIQQSGAIDRFHCRLSATGDFTDVTGVAACIVADRVGPPPAEWQGEEGLAMLGRLLPYASGAPVIFAGASQAELMFRVGADLKIGPYTRVGPYSVGRRELLIGTAVEAYASALRAIVALEARCSPGEVMLSVLGVPPHLVVPWSEASIGGYGLDRVLTTVQIARIDARAARLWPPGPYTLGAAAARAAEAIVTSSRRTFSILTLLGGEFGVRDRIGAVPALLSRHGIAEVRVPSLNTKERVLLETALGAP